MSTREGWTWLWNAPKELYDEYRRINAEIGSHEFWLRMWGCWHFRKIARLICGILRSMTRGLVWRLLWLERTKAYAGRIFL